MATSVPPRDDLDLMLMLAQASHALTSELTAALAKLGISPRAHCVLAHAQSGTLTQSELADVCALDKTTMVATLDELERAGLARRQLSSTDRRARIVTVTAAGKRKTSQADAITEGVVNDVLSTLSASDRRAFTTALRRLVDERLSSPVPCEPPVRRRRASAHPR